MTEPNELFASWHKIYRVDTDGSGIVFPSRVVDLAVKLVDSWFVERVFLERDVPELRAVFASLSCTFVAPMRPGEVLEMRLALRRIGRSSLSFELVGHREADNKVCWTAEAVCVLVDRNSVRSQRIPESLRPVLEAEAALATRGSSGDRNPTP
ncbi:MAG: hypothetical protein INR65_05320 [Gluconacetobacter diazotrophicus]|nr:hypothetical protein [Gluconacetobacter diazotrophicus]